jgi:uncharacterized repeat protein (TIGR01451 family)
MNINLDDYPSLIAVPYQKSSNGNIQQKEYQRICLEMILSFNAIVCLSIYSDLKKSGKVEDLAELNLDLGQMSIGKWNAVARTTSEVLGKATKDSLVKEIYDLYHGSKKKDWNAIVDDLISRRNRDAHGEVTSASGLHGELNERQQMLDRLMELLLFYKNYRLMINYDNEIKRGTFAYICKMFYGDKEHIESITNSKNELEKYRPYLFHLSSGKSLDLSPMAISHPESDEILDTSIFIYSKTLSKKAGNLHYLNWKCSKDFIAEQNIAPGEFITPDQLCKEFKSFRIYVEDESLVYQNQPSIMIERKFRESVLSKGENAIMSVSIKNVGDADAENVNAILDYPQEGFLRINSDEKEMEQKAIKISIPFLVQGELWEEEFFFRSKDSGQYEFSPMTLFYSYKNNKNQLVEPDDQKDTNKEFSPAILYEVHDPDDPDSQIPIINISMAYDNYTPHIGDKVTLTIDIKNIGRSVANDVKISILPPKDQIELLEGSPDWKGTLNPGESQKSQFILQPRTHGVFSMKMRDVVYRNQRGDLFKTLAYEDQKILIRNNLEVQYRFLMEDIWSDLVLNEDEKFEVELFSRKYTIDPEKKQEIESEVKIRIIKKIIKNIAGRGGWKIREIANKEMCAFCIGPCPFMVIDFSEMDSIKLFFKGNINGPHFKKQSIKWRGKFKEMVFTMLPLSEISSIGDNINDPQSKKQNGIDRLKGIISQSLRWVEQHDYLLALLANDIADILRIKRESIDILLEGRYTGYNDLVVNGFYAFFDDKKQVNIIASYPQQAGIGSWLKEAGYRFVKVCDLDSEQPFEMTDKVRTFVHIDSQKLDKNNRANLLKRVPDFVLTCMDMAYKQFLSEFKEAPLQADCLEFIDKTISEHEKEYSCKIDKKEKSITYCEGRGFPIYKPGSDFLKIRIKKSGMIIGFRILSRKAYDDLGDKLSVQKSYWPYEINFNESIKNILAESIDFALRHNNKEIQDLSYGFLKEILENMWISNFDLLLKKLMNKHELTFQEGDQLLRENNIKAKISSVTRSINTFFNTQRMDPPIAINYSSRTIAIKESYYDFVSDSIKEYKLNVDNDVQAFHNFKLLINKLNANKANMSYLTRVILPRTIFSSENFKYSEGIYFDLTLKDSVVQIRLAIKDNPLCKEIKAIHKNLIDQNSQQIGGKDLIAGSVKGGGANSYALFIQFPLEDVGQMKDKDWVNGFVDNFNEFVRIFLKKDFEMLRLNYLE